MVGLPGKRKKTGFTRSRCEFFHKQPPFLMGLFVKQFTRETINRYCERLCTMTRTISRFLIVFGVVGGFGAALIAMAPKAGPRRVDVVIETR